MAFTAYNLAQMRNLGGVDTLPKKVSRGWSTWNRGFQPEYRLKPHWAVFALKKFDDKSASRRKEGRNSAAC
jgi:hypothetical protein